MRQRRFPSVWPHLRRVIAGIVLALLVPLAATGAALVWQPEIAALLHPDRVAAPVSVRLAPDVYASAATARLRDDERIATIDYAPGAVTVRAMATAAEGPDTSSALDLDPASARVLAVDDRRAGFMLTLRAFHDRLLLASGAPLVGVIGVVSLIALLASWWRRPGRTVTQRIGAVAAALPLAVALATGVWAAFPAFFGSLTGAPPAPRPVLALPLRDTALTADAALARALPLSVGALQVIEWPTEARPDWRLVFAGGPVSVADDSIAVAPARARVDEPAPAGGVTAWVRDLHGGSPMPLWWRVVLTLAGLTPLAIVIGRWLPRRRRPR